VESSGVGIKNWSSLFYALAELTREGRVIILFDEISWMGSLDPLFLANSKMPGIWNSKK